MLVGKLVDVADDLQRLPRAAERRRDELEQCLGKICRDEAIGQCRAKTWRMRCLRQVTVGSNAQGLLLDPPLAAGHRRFVISQQGTEALLKHLIHSERFTTSSAGALYPRAARSEPVSGRPVL